jgi:hypothetical protein
VSVRARIAALVLATAVAFAAGVARADGPLGFVSGLQYGVAGGQMIPEGPQGVSLARGPSVSVSVLGESALGMQLGAAVAYAASDDILRTKFTSLSGVARLSPLPDDYRAFVQLSAGLYHVTYDPKVSTLASPGSTTRPGGGFGLGWDVIDTSNFGLGAIVTYQGVILGRTEARSYLVAALSVTFKPSPY